jgi:EAL domain-containing protein (putative c-di-GMP-specific phosphodiesterase class I)
MTQCNETRGLGGAGQLSAAGGLPPDACVLVVDDEPANVVLLERVIRSAGIATVVSETDPSQAVRRCSEVAPDLVLLDLHMPSMDGFAVMSALRAALPDDAFVPVVVLTADTTTESRDRALSEGAKDFLTKPFDRTEVILRVRNLLETRMLYRDVQRHNASLEADLAERLEEERRRSLEHEQRLARIDAALAGDALQMVFQPIADLSTGDVLGVEALARFTCEPKRPPNEWFDEAVVVGRGPQLEIAAVSAALRRLPQIPSDAFMSVNISPATVLEPELTHVLEGVQADRIVLELTEHTRIDDYEPLLATLERLRDGGVRVAVDDAGAGYSGLQHVLRLRPDILKLDTTLTSGIDHDPARRALGTAMVTFAREIDAVIIAEGIETPEELETLRDLGTPWGQGFHLARPGSVPLESPRLAGFAAAT